MDFNVVTLAEIVATMKLKVLVSCINSWVDKNALAAKLAFALAAMSF